MAEVKSLKFLKPFFSNGPGRELLVELQDSSSSQFSLAQPSESAAWLKQGPGYYFSAPVLFVAGADEESVGEAAVAMAGEMGGYWLRYYNSAGRVPRAGKPADVASIEITGANAKDTAVVEAKIDDGRIFSILTSTPASFAAAFSRHGLRYYYGPSILLLRDITPDLARAAVEKMAQHPDHWLCRYDTPRRTLGQILEEFSARHRAR